MCFTGYRLWCRLRVEGAVFTNHSHTSHFQSYHCVKCCDWMTLFAVFFLIFILHVLECTIRLHEDGAVVKRSTAGTVFWGVIWGLLALHSAGFPVSLYGWLPLLSATLPSHQICLNVGSNLWDLCFLSPSTESFSCCCACLVITCPFPLQSSSHVVTGSSFYENASLFLFEFVHFHQGYVVTSCHTLCAPDRGRVNPLLLSVSILPLSLSPPLSLFLRLPNMNKGGALNSQHGQRFFPIQTHTNNPTPPPLPPLFLPFLPSSTSPSPFGLCALMCRSVASWCAYPCTLLNEWGCREEVGEGEETGRR